MILRTFILCMPLAWSLSTGCSTPKIVADLRYFPPPPSNSRVVHLKSFNRLYDLVSPPERARSFLRGTAPSPFVGRPAGIDFVDNTLLICDAQRGVVHQWNLDTGVAQKLGDKSRIRLSKPVAVSANADTIYIADTIRAEIVAYDRTGTCTTRLRPPASTDFRPVDVVIHQSRLYAANVANHSVEIFDVVTDQWSQTIGHAGSGEGAFYFPMGAAVDDKGRLLVADSMNARIQILNRQHKHFRTFGQRGNRYGDLGQPRHLATGPDGTIFVADPEFSAVHLFNSEGQLLMLIESAAKNAPNLQSPVSLAVAEILPDAIVESLVPHDFSAHYFLFVANSLGSKRLSLYAIGVSRE